MIISERTMALSAKAELRYRERTTVREARLTEHRRGNLMGVDEPARIAKRPAHVAMIENCDAALRLSERASASVGRCT